MKQERGVTFVETVIVLGILGVLLALVLPLPRQFHLNALLLAEVSALAADLRRAQSAAISGANDSAHGVHLDPTPTDRWVIFRGSTYTPGVPENEVHVLPDSLDMTSVVIAGGSDIVFAERRGTTANTGTMTLRAPNGLTRTISVNARGAVDIQ